MDIPIHISISMHLFQYYPLSLHFILLTKLKTKQDILSRRYYCFRISFLCRISMKKWQHHQNIYIYTQKRTSPTLNKFFKHFLYYSLAMMKVYGGKCPQSFSCSIVFNIPNFSLCLLPFTCLFRRTQATHTRHDIHTSKGKLEKCVDQLRTIFFLLFVELLYYCVILLMT